MIKRAANKGQMQLSFGMIFSIIIIVATLAIAGYVIIKFLNLQSNISCKLFYSDLQNKVNKAWYEDFTSSTYTKEVPRGISNVCFGNFTQKISEKDREIIEEIEFYAERESNLFFYPLSVCKQNEFAFQIVHSYTNSFFCIPVKEGKVSFKLNKSISDPLVRLSE